jgi:hypothetical protein
MPMHSLYPMQFSATLICLKQQYSLLQPAITLLSSIAARWQTQTGRTSDYWVIKAVSRADKQQRQTTQNRKNACSRAQPQVLTCVCPSKRSRVNSTLYSHRFTWGINTSYTWLVSKYSPYSFLSTRSNMMFDFSINIEAKSMAKQCKAFEEGVLRFMTS